MSDQQRVSLSEICFLRNGAGIKQECFGNDGAKIIRVSDFTDTSIDTSSSIRINRKYENRWRGYFLNEGDILVATVGSWSTSATSAVGKVVTVPAQATNGIQNQNTCAIIPKSDVADQRYIYYALRQEDFRGFVAGAAAGSANQARLSVKNPASYLVTIFSLPEQKSIAHILGTLDDKIELNRKTNETLEAMAKALFKSLFVDFDPVRAKAEGRPTGLPAEISDLFPDSFEDSELGEIPSGWKVKTIEEIAEKDAMGPFGSNIKVSTFVDRGIPVISGQHLKGAIFHDGGNNFITPDHADRLKNSCVRRGDIVFTHAGSIGQVSLIPVNSEYQKYVLSQRQFYLRPGSNNLSHYLTMFFRSANGQVSNR
jgi:type I restriction enzyme S subunit